MVTLAVRYESRLWKRLFLELGDESLKHIPEHHHHHRQEDCLDVLSQLDRDIQNRLLHRYPSSR